MTNTITIPAGPIVLTRDPADSTSAPRQWDELILVVDDEGWHVGTRRVSGPNEPHPTWRVHFLLASARNGGCVVDRDAVDHDLNRGEIAGFIGDFEAHASAIADYAAIAAIHAAVSEGYGDDRWVRANLWVTDTATYLLSGMSAAEVMAEYGIANSRDICGLAEAINQIKYEAVMDDAVLIDDVGSALLDIVEEEEERQAQERMA